MLSTKRTQREVDKKTEDRAVHRSLKLPKKAHFFLFGPRQVGKSTLIRDSFSEKKTIFYNLLKDKEYTRLVANLDLFREEVLALKKSITHIVIDEIQRLPALLNEIHYLIEEDKIPQFFILSGSSARKLKRGQANLLGGRAWTRHLYPFTHQELKKDFNLDRALRFGTLPPVYLSEDDSAKEILESYIETYLTEEIKAEALVRNIGSFTRFLKLAASESSNIINYSNIARETATSSQSIKEYFQILEDTLIGYILLPYNKSDRKRLGKHPKFYLFDNGIKNALTKDLNDPVEPKTSAYGVAFEHFIINEIIILNKYHKKNMDFSFYRNSNGAEVDLIIETEKKNILAVEIKSSENPNQAELRGLFSFQELEPKAKLICLSRAEKMRIANGIHYYPWKLFFEEFF